MHRRRQLLARGLRGAVAEIGSELRRVVLVARIDVEVTAAIGAVMLRDSAEFVAHAEPLQLFVDRLDLQLQFSRSRLRFRILLGLVLAIFLAAGVVLELGIGLGLAVRIECARSVSTNEPANFVLVLIELAGDRLVPGLGRGEPNPLAGHLGGNALRHAPVLRPLRELGQVREAKEILPLDERAAEHIAGVPRRLKRVLRP
jgi:hypothetical protein